MAGIVHGLRNTGDLDEAPGAYKDIDTVMANQTDLVKITTGSIAVDSLSSQTEQSASILTRALCTLKSIYDSRRAHSLIAKWPP